MYFTSNGVTYSLSDRGLMASCGIFEKLKCVIAYCPYFQQLGIMVYAGAVRNCLYIFNSFQHLRRHYRYLSISMHLSLWNIVVHAVKLADFFAICLYFNPLSFSVLRFCPFEA